MFKKKPAVVGVAVVAGVAVLTIVGIKVAKSIKSAKAEKDAKENLEELKKQAGTKDFETAFVSIVKEDTQ